MMRLHPHPHPHPRPQSRHRVPQVFSTRCAGCNEPGTDLCDACRFSLASSRPVDVGDDVLAALAYEGVARRSILALKFRNRRTVARHLARLIVTRLGAGASAPLAGAARSRQFRQFDVVTWAPTGADRVRSRGYDQAELLARAVAKELRVPCHRLLYRTHGAPQAGHGRADRLVGPGFRARATRRPLRVLVVDDVITTGATLRRAGEALRLAGIDAVTLVAIAAAPDRVESLVLRHAASRLAAAS